MKLNKKQEHNLPRAPEGNVREEDLKKRGEGLWRKTERQWVSTLGLRQDWRQQTGYLGRA